MLRRIALDKAVGTGHLGLPIDMPPSILSQALGSLVDERQSDGTPSVAVERLCDALISDSPTEAKDFVHRLLACGVSVDTLYDNYMPQAAVRLGDLWLEDRLSFTAVTLGMGRLTDAFRSLSPIFMKTRRPMRRNQRALFALVPGEEHAFGIVLAADHFQRAGWTVQVELRAGQAELDEMVARQPFDLIGLSAGSRRILPALERSLDRLRRRAAPGTRFALGGALLGLEPDLAARLGAEFDARSLKDTLYELGLRQ